MSEQTPAFDLLSPDFVLEAVESVFDIDLTSVVTPYSSYINRVYGLASDDGDRYVVKFYRPGRWSAETILDEHRFVRDCAAADLPVVIPVENEAGTTLQMARPEPGEGAVDSAAGGPGTGGRVEHPGFFFALYPSKGGRHFDAEGDDDWVRLGSVVARLHVVGREAPAPHRMRYTPAENTSRYLAELAALRVVHPEVSGEFFSLAEGIVDEITPLFEDVKLQRIHGDCHRGNILDRPGEGLMLIDFDDMLMGPAVQDIWLLLPDYASESYRELELIIEGYEQFIPFDRRYLGLIEPLRFMRMIHYLAWAAKQRHDARFRNTFPDWGGKAFWIKEVEDLSVQRNVIRSSFRE